MYRSIKNQTRILSAIFLILIVFSTGYSQKTKVNNVLNIKNVELGYPVPAIPFYHFKADIELPRESIIEVEAAVDGKVLRATDLKRNADHENMNRPPLSERPPSGYSMSQDATLYKALSVVGWIKWEPGKSYNIRISVRMKKSAHASTGDEWISANRSVSAPQGVDVFSKDWKSYKSVILSETAGISRTSEPVEVLLAFYPDEAQTIARDIRVVEIDPVTHSFTEVPSQVYDQMEYLTEDDLGPDKDGKSTRQVPLWLPTVTARVAFLADVPSKSSRVFLVYYNNPDAMVKSYMTDLRVQGEAPGLQIDNSKIEVALHPTSGHLDQINLKTNPEFPLYHRLETNGAIHWNPGIYTPPRAWTHTSDWKTPKSIKTMSGPVIAKSEVYDNMRGVEEVEASVRYEFYSGVPYFISTTSMRIKETVNALALRNAEIVFKRELMTHAAWYDIVRDSVIIYDVSHMPDLTDLKMEADIPWIIFFNKEKGVGFAGIQLDYANVGMENQTRLLNPFFYITGGPWIYWARGLSHPFLSSNMQQVVPVPKGNVFYEKWAYLIFETDKTNTPYEPVIEWHKRLTNPLRIQLVEEVDEKVSKTLQEVFMDEGKSGWEGRDTHK
ncbi:MAG TPA: hypothetical protein VMV47_12400 [Bacteroidales bacterium]|nr:hypothetical protein [Bacteroidales bacterium]